MSDEKTRRVVAENRRARHDYLITEILEVGIMLQGTEVKSLRKGHSSIVESYATIEMGRLTLINAHIPEYLEANRFNHDPKRPRLLLVHKKELRKLDIATKRKGMTLVPMELFFNARGKAKLIIGIASGRKKADKRAHEKDQDWKRQQARIMRARG